MSWAYLAGSLGGIILLVALCAALFGTRRAAIPPQAVLEASLAKTIPGFRIRALAADSHAALAENAADGAVYLVVAHGDGFVTRRLSPELLAAIARDAASLTLRLADFTLPAVRLVLPDSDAAARWQARLAP
jgi:hypothetical protein